MRITPHILIALFTLVQGKRLAQGLYGKTWVISEPNVTLSFNKQSNGSYQYALNSTLTFPPYATYKGVGFGHSSICDSATGALQFYTNGPYIYDANAQPLDNSDSLISPYAYSKYYWINNNQGCIILPKGNKKYDIFFPYFSDSKVDSAYNLDLMLHHEVDMNANGGLGSVTKKQEEILHSKGTLDFLNMDAVRHANGIDWWLLKLGYGKPANSYTDSMYLYTWLVKADTIEGPYLHYAGDAGKKIYDCGFSFRNAQMKFSMDGTKFAGTRGCRNFYYADFNRCSGAISNMEFKEYPIDTSSYFYGDTTAYYDSILILAPTCGITYSPNNKYIYLSCGYRIWQYEPTQTDSALAWVQIMTVADTVNAYLKSTIQYAPDSTLLVFPFGGSAPNGYLNGIVHPDKKGKACTFKSNVVSFGSGQPWKYISNCPNQPNWALGKDDRICWPLGNQQLAVSYEQFSMYPNPASNSVKIVIPKLQNQELSIYNASGQKMYSKNMHQLQLNIDVSRWVRGVYFVKYMGSVQKLIIE